MRGIEYISGLIVSFLILFLGFQLLQESVGKILQPEEAAFSPAAVVGAGALLRYEGVGSACFTARWARRISLAHNRSPLRQTA